MTNNGNHNYTVTGTLRGASDTGQETAIKIDFTGTVPFNNYSTPPAPEAPKATMTVGDLYYNGDNVFFLGLKDGSPIKNTASRSTLRSRPQILCNSPAATTRAVPPVRT